jgi:hypothetical protein
LTLQRQGWFADSYVSEKGVQRREAVVTGPRAVTPGGFEMFQELSQEWRIEIFHAKLGGCASKMLGRELEQQTKGVPICCDCMRTCTLLRSQPLSKETLDE